MTLAIDVSQWGWPQWTWLGLAAVNLLINAVMDGKPRTDNYSAGVYLVAALFGGFIVTSGGFFA
jgi:hypothetical protein